MAAPRTYNDQQREAINELANEQGLPLRQVQANLAAGYKDLEPFKPSTATLASIAREFQPRAKDEEEPAAIADQLARETLALIGEKLKRVKKDPDSFDADDMLKIVRTLVEAKGLAQSGKKKGQDTEKQGLLGSLTGPEARDTANVTHIPSRPVSTRAAS